MFRSFGSLISLKEQRRLVAFNEPNGPNEANGLNGLNERNDSNEQ